MLNRRNFLKTAGTAGIIVAAPSIFIPKLIEVARWKRFSPKELVIKVPDPFSLPNLTPMMEHGIETEASLVFSFREQLLTWDIGHHNKLKQLLFGSSRSPVENAIMKPIWS